MGVLCDADCAVTFTHEEVIVRKNQGTAKLTRWREATRLRICLISLQPGESKLPSMPNDAKQSIMVAYSAYDLPIVVSLIIYLHAAAGYLSWSTWLKATGVGNYLSWPGLTLANTTKYCPSTKSTIMGHLVQKRQGVRSTKPNPPPPSLPEEPMPFRTRETIFRVF